MSRWLTIFFGAGLLRPAPGTWGSAVAILLGLMIDRSFGVFALAGATFAVTVLGLWACARELKGRPGDDPGEIVIDEVAGQWLALLFPAFAFWHLEVQDWAYSAWPAWVAAFLFFRLFDIWKPWIIGWADRRSGASGVMLDDLIAGLFAGIAVMAAAGVAHGALL